MYRGQSGCQPTLTGVQGITVAILRDFYGQSIGYNNGFTHSILSLYARPSLSGRPCKASMSAWFQTLTYIVITYLETKSLVFTVLTWEPGLACLHPKRYSLPLMRSPG